MFRAAYIFSSDMVLQRDKNITVWGESDAEGAEVTAHIGENSARTKVTDGKWRLTLPPMPAGGPYTLELFCKLSGNGTVSSDTIRFENVMIGEVWLCGGQSNMELELQNCKGGKDILSSLTPDCNVRFYYTPKKSYIDESHAAAEKASHWSLAGREESAAWSAVGFFFARKLAADLGITVGLIGCNWGGTSASAWVDRDTLADSRMTVPYLEDFAAAVKGKSEAQQIKEYDEWAERHAAWWKRVSDFMEKNPGVSWDVINKTCGEYTVPPMGIKCETRPCGLYESMLMRVCPYTLRGFLYYQGESDDHRPDSYYKLFTSLISLWRERWGDDTLPFILTQLPMYKSASDPDYKHWCIIREAQMKAFRTVKNTGIAVTTDCGEFDNIHPVDKLPVGERLCLQAEKLVYGMDVDAFGPLFRDLVYKDGGALLSFDHAEKGFDLHTDTVTGFELAGADKNFVPAEADIRGSEIFISSPDVSDPQYVRYDWSNWIVPSLFGKNGIPLAPFTTER